jgi:hypothetical protein
MAMRSIPLLACLAVLPLTSCNKPAAPAAVPGPKSGQLTCAVVSAQEHTLDGGTDLRVWSLKANGLKRLTARLLVATDGKVQVANEIEYKWNEWDSAAPEASGQLVLLIQDGKAFGVNDMRLPLIALDLQGSPSHAKTGNKMQFLLSGELHPRMSSSSYATPLANRSVLYAQIFLPKADAPGPLTLGSDVDSLAAASKEGGTVLAVALEWAPQ